MFVPDSVRLVMPVEAVDIARPQRKSWSRQSGIAAALAAIPADQAVHIRRETIVKPPLIHHRVLVALSRGQVVGFVVAGPSDGLDTEVTDGAVAKLVTDVGVLDDHASCLVNAAVDTLRADGYETVTWRIRSDDDALRGFLIGCGRTTDGAHRSLRTEDGMEIVKQARLVTRITDQGPTTDTG